MISVVFQRVEEHNLGKDEWQNFQSQKKIESNNLVNTFINLNHTADVDVPLSKRESILQQEQPASPKALTEENGTQPDMDKSNIEPNTGEKSTRVSGSVVLPSKDSSHSKDNAENSEPKSIDAMIGSYISKSVQCLVDDIVLYDAKIQKVMKFSQDDPNKDTEALNEELKNIPLRSVPLLQHAEDPRYRRTIGVVVDNELGFKSGLFGW